MNSDYKNMTANLNNSGPKVLAADVLREMGIMDFSPPAQKKSSSGGKQERELDPPKQSQVSKSGPNAKSVLHALATTAVFANSPNETTRAFFQISENLCPKSIDEKSERVEFLVYMFIQASYQVIKSLAEARQKSDGCSASSTEIECAIKSLATMSAYIAGLEHGGASSPEWFVEFIFLVIRGIDVRKPSPRARSIVEQFGALRDEAMQKELATAIADLLGLQGQRDYVTSEICVFITESRLYRNELFMFALGQSRKTVQEHMAMLNMLAA